MNLQQKIFEVLEKECGGIKNIRGVTENALKGMRDGKHMPSIVTLMKIFAANDMKSELIIHTKKDKKGKTKFDL